MSKINGVHNDFRDVLKVKGVNAKGYGIIPKMVMLDRKLTVEAKAVYGYFCSYAGTGTTAFPSVKKIIKDLNIGKTRYYKHFGLLKDFGYIEVEQVKQDGSRFSHNIYTLVENPIILSCLQNENPENSSGKSPCPRFGDTENEDTENEDTIINMSSYKINNSLYNYQSVRQNDQPDGQTEYEKIKTYFQDKLKFGDLKFSHYAEKKLIDEIELNIYEMYFNDFTVVQGSKQPREIVRNALMKLTYWHIDALIMKFLEVSCNTRVKNLKGYIQAMIYNIAYENELSLQNELKNTGLI
ncbi:MAG TPA: hypothetical protein DC024_04460 [Clostridiales bacterium]|jgi:hypothetical protein|nr:hypothetical protein [Clostridiales bacterium]HCS10554.1 hypothetical protein [Clostridiales bacterium]